MASYYNENNPATAQWLRNLIAADHLPAGDVDERSILNVKKDDLRGYDQYHFFAGIGGWPLAFRLAGWPDDRSVWSGSCPCGPYSIIGERKASADDRDLWPVWNELIEQSTPVIFGEQVADAIPLGWLDRLADDLETKEKSIWSVVLPSCSTGQGNKGERLFFMAEANKSRLERHAWHELEIIERAIQDRYVAEAGICNFIEGWDGLKRPIKPGVHLLADGIPPPLARICAEGFGNAINPQVAAEFIKATM